MRRAIALSALGFNTTSPNPPVGCVILDSTGQPVGEGYHLRKGEPHAEVHALAAAGVYATGGTAVVTLEPCNHYGRTPPCHQSLSAGLRGCVTRALRWRLACWPTRRVSFSARGSPRLIVNGHK